MCCNIYSSSFVLICLFNYFGVNCVLIYIITAFWQIYMCIYFKLRLILRREENWRTRRKPSKHRRDQLQQLYSHEFQVFLTINTRLYPGGHPSSYNPVRSGLTRNSVVKASNALTASAIRAPDTQRHWNKWFILKCCILHITFTFGNSDFLILT